MDVLKYHGNIYGEDMSLKIYRHVGQMLNDILGLSNILDPSSRMSFIEGFMTPVDMEGVHRLIGMCYRKLPIEMNIEFKPVSVVLTDDNDDGDDSKKSRYNFNFFYVTDLKEGISDLLLACKDPANEDNFVLYDLDGKLTFLKDGTSSALGEIFAEHFDIPTPGVLFKDHAVIAKMSEERQTYFKSRFATNFILDRIDKSYIVMKYSDMQDILIEEESPISLNTELKSTLVEVFTSDDRVVCAKLSDLDFSITGVYTVAFADFNPEVDTAIVLCDDMKVNGITPISGNIPKCISTEVMKECFTMDRVEVLFKEGAKARKAKRIGRDIKKGTKRTLAKVLGLPATALKAVLGLKGQVETVLTEIRHTREKHIRKQLSEDRYILVFGKFLTSVLGLIVAGTLVSTAGLTWVAGITVGLIVKFLADYNDERTRSVGVRLIHDQLELVEMQIQHADANGDKKAVYSLKIYEQSLKARLARNKLRNLI